MLSHFKRFNKASKTFKLKQSSSTISIYLIFGYLGSKSIFRLFDHLVIFPILLFASSACRLLRHSSKLLFKNNYYDSFLTSALSNEFANYSGHISLNIFLFVYGLKSVFIKLFNNRSSNRLEIAF